MPVHTFWDTNSHVHNQQMGFSTICLTELKVDDLGNVAGDKTVQCPSMFLEAIGLDKGIDSGLDTIQDLCCIQIGMALPNTRHQNPPFFHVSYHEYTKNQQISGGGKPRALQCIMPRTAFYCAEFSSS